MSKKIKFENAALNPHGILQDDESVVSMAANQIEKWPIVFDYIVFFTISAVIILGGYFSVVGNNYKSMEGDSRNPRMSLLKKYDVPVQHLSYDYVENCYNRKELERIIRILRSGEEGYYPDLLKDAEDRLRLFAPDSRVLRVETPILTKECLTKEEWDAVETELLSWEEEMNVMDKTLDFEKGRIEVVGNKNFPDVRKVVKPPHPKCKTEKKNKAVINSNNRRIKSGDYSAWDKFDVDKELLKIDVEEERKQEENEKKKREAKKVEQEKKIEIVDIDKGNYSLMEEQVLATQAKDRGNECYKSGDLESALKYYEISIKLHSTANAYNNRAMTYLKLKQFENALKDCNTALQLEKNNIKALYRRATAYQNMPRKTQNDYYDELALKDLCQIIILEPNNKVAQADLQKLKKKLNIEYVGKKFRIPISEELTSNKNFKQITEKKSTFNRTDNDMAIERLPLTYYGPSTSTFQCEPYSMVHRALLGSSMSGQVLCKCNSNRPKQNPLCQRCGEAMCTPKPTKVVSANQIKTSSKKENDTESQQQPKKTLKADNGSSNLPNDTPTMKNTTADVIKTSSTLKSNPAPEVNAENHSKNGAKYIGIESIKNSDDNNNINNNHNSPSNLNRNNSAVNYVSKKPVDLTENSLTLRQIDSNNPEKEDMNSQTTTKTIAETQVEKSVSDQIKSFNKENSKTPESFCNKSIETKVTENTSSQGDVNRNSKKSKNKKKKSKEHKESKGLRKQLEPVKVVHAAKYINPTSVEPKVKNETTEDKQLEPIFSTNIQHKAFIPNKKCCSAEYQRMDPSAATTISSAPKNGSIRDNEVGNDSSYEGNKENILENNCSVNVENAKREDDADDVKREAVDSAFEFIKTWEELKKFDESYAKRAEIIRKIRPKDLSKVIGIKLDSDMLSCLLECLLRHFAETDPKRVVELLKQLPQVPRFGLVSMFLGDADKKKILKLIEAVEGKGFRLDEDVKKNLTILS